MALNELDDDSFHENPPRLSYALDQDDDLEGARRALFTDRQRRSRLSLGDPSLGDLNDMGMEDGSDIDDDELRGRDLPDYDIEDDLDDLEAEYAFHTVGQVHSANETQRGDWRIAAISQDPLLLQHEAFSETYGPAQKQN